MRSQHSSRTSRRGADRTTTTPLEQDHVSTKLQVCLQAWRTPTALGEGVLACGDADFVVGRRVRPRRPATHDAARSGAAKPHVKPNRSIRSPSRSHGRARADGRRSPLAGCAFTAGACCGPGRDRAEDQRRPEPHLGPLGGGRGGEWQAATARGRHRRAPEQDRSDPV